MKSANSQVLSYLFVRKYLPSNCHCGNCARLDDVPVKSTVNDSNLSIPPFAPSWEIPGDCLSHPLDVLESEKKLKINV